MRAGAEAAFLVIGVSSEVLCCIGVMTMRGVFPKLHYMSATSTVGATALVLAVVVRSGPSATSLKAMAILAILWTSGPVLTHAMGRVAARSEHPEAAGREP